MKKVILVDGNNLLFRSYYATAYTGNIMRNSAGFPTNALFGFINMMNKILKEDKPNYIMVAFDHGKTFRHKEYNTYKGGRKDTPEELKMQFPVAKEILDALGIFHFEVDNYEADDIIGTAAKIVEKEDEFIATIVSSDKDLLQLISKEVDVKLLKMNGYMMMNEDTFRQIYGIEPPRMIDLKALMGDASDNIPGVKGIGEKTALTLLKSYGSLDGVYDHIEEIKGKTKEKLETDKENAYMSYHLATIYRDIELPFSLEDLYYRGFNKEKYVSILNNLEFSSLLKRVDDMFIEDKSEVIVKAKEEISFKTVSSIDLKDIGSPCAFYIETNHIDYNDTNILGIGLYDGIHAYFIEKENISSLKEFFESSIEKYTYDLKKAIVLLNAFGIKLKNVSFDTMIATYLLNYTVKDDIAFVGNDMGYPLSGIEEKYGTVKRPKKVTLEESSQMCLEKAKFIFDTEEELSAGLTVEEETSLFREIEMPLVEVLADMELVGIKVSKEHLQAMGEELGENIHNLEKEIYQESGVEFNIASPKQLGEVLFKQMGLPYPKKIKDDNYSTSRDILAKLLPVHPIIEKILVYRTLTKLYNNYAIGLVGEIKEDGRIHTVFNQTLTRTGRLSSVRPNLQNIPAREEYGRQVRKAFVADENSILLSSDYSQIELRVFAHLSNATNLIQAFIDNKDIHSQTASDIFGVPIENVTKAMRRNAKAVNFGILYGISSFGLSEDLGIDVKSAKNFIDTYLNTYPGIKEYMDLEIKEAYKKGYVKTIMNRKRNLEELKDKSYMVRSQGERMALNTPIQGSAADILKKAMVLIYQEFKRQNLKSKMLLQVHDELVFNVIKEEEEVVTKIVQDIMENVVTLDVPLKVEIAKGDNWYEAK